MSPKQLRWYSLRVGIVVLIGLVVFVFVISVVGTEQNIFTSTYRIKVFMPNVLGLVRGGMVTLGGLKVGYVTEMKFTTRNDTAGVELTLTLDTKYGSVITTSSVGQIKTIGLLGDKYIDITIGKPGETALAEDAFLPLKESFDLEAAGPQIKASLADFTETLKEIKGVARSINKGEGSVGKFIKEPKIADEMERFLKSMNSMMAAIEAQKGAAGKLIYDPAMAKNLADLSANLKAVTDNIRQGKGTMGKLIMEDTLYTNLTGFTSRADKLMAKVADDSSNVSKLIGDPNFYGQIVGLLKDLNLLLVDLREHPSRYVHVSVF